MHDLATWPDGRLALVPRALLGVDQVGALLSTMIQPPACPDDVRPWEWRFRVQVAAALILAGVETEWIDSTRRAALLSLLHGPVDWTTTAGAIALVEVAVREEDLRDEIVALLLPELQVPPSPVRFQCVIQPIPALMLARLPLPEEHARTLRHYRNLMEFDR
jgi:hypothetical protein